MINNSLLDSTSSLAHELSQLLESSTQQIVFAESCTAGLVASILAQVPGISNWLCGSAVTYQESVKQQWLQVDQKLIDQFTAVSSQVTLSMAERVLVKTRQANLSVAVTGHLNAGETNAGPLAFVAVGCRNHERIVVTQPERKLLTHTSRIDRQWEAAQFSLQMAVNFIKSGLSE